MGNCLVSIIIPIYNQKKYVGKCLRSVCNQTYGNLEVICVNDGSTDDSLSIISKYAEEDQRIRIISKENEGVALARRDGLKIARGEYVTFVDSDDFLLDTAIEDLLKPAEEYGVDVVKGGFCRYYWKFLRRVQPQPASLPLGRLIYQEELFDQYYISFFGNNIVPVYMWGGLYRKSVIDMAMLKETLFDKDCLHMGEDEYFNLMLFPYLNTLYVIDKVIYYYRFGGITSSYNKYLTELFYLGDIRVKLLDKYNYLKGYGPLFKEYKNILFSELLQRIMYKHPNKQDLKEYITDELNTRYLVSRMQDYYKNNPCPDYMRPVVEKDIDYIYSHAMELKRTKRKRFFITKVLSLFLKFM